MNRETHFTPLQLTACFIALVMVFIMSCQEKTETAIATHSVTDSVFSEDGLAIYYDVSGKDEKALVFVHGWSCDRSYWDEQVPEFNKNYTVVTVDLADHGESTLGREKWTISSFGADVAAVVEQLDLNNIILVGHSMGGPVSIEASRRLGDRVVAIVGVDNFQDFSHQFSDEQIEQFLAPFRSDFVGATNGFVRSMFPPTADSVLVEQIATDMSAAPAEVAISAFSDLFRYDYAAALEDVRIPIRCINSDIWPTNVIGNQELAASFKLKLMPGTGHFLHMEDPNAFNQLLHETLAEFWPSGEDQ